MLKKLTGRNNREHRGMKARIACVNPCYYDCLLHCDTRPGFDRSSLDAVESYI